MHAATTSTESLLRLSLNDLLFLEALVRLESLKDAADEFGLTRASASRTLARLRAAAGEPLFVRSNPNLVPTPEARRLATAIRRLRLVTRELAPPGAPEPLTLARHFTIGAGENATYAFCLPVIERLNTIAPRVSVSIEHFEPERLFELLQSGKLDIAFYPQEVLPPHFESAVLSTNNIVAMVRREHPLLDLARERELTLGDLEAYPKIRVSSAVARPKTTSPTSRRSITPAARPTCRAFRISSRPWNSSRARTRSSRLRSERPKRRCAVFRTARFSRFRPSGAGTTRCVRSGTGGFRATRNSFGSRG